MAWMKPSSQSADNASFRVVSYLTEYLFVHSRLGNKNSSGFFLFGKVGDAYDCIKVITCEIQKKRRY